MLLQSVSKYNFAFEGAIDEEGEAALCRIAALCASVPTKGRQLRQPLPSAKPCEHLDTLMLLFARAVAAAPRLLALATAATVAPGIKPDSCKVVPPPKPTKGIARALQKAQEEYEGDYTRSASPLIDSSTPPPSHKEIAVH